MAKKKTTAKKAKTKPTKKPISFKLSRQQQIILGSFLFFLGIGLLFSFISYFFTWKADQSLIIDGTRDDETANWLSLTGARISHLFVYKGFGIPSLTIAILTTLSGIYYFFDYKKTTLKKYWFWGLLLMIWLSVFLGFFHKSNDILGGMIGYETNDFLQDYLGLTGAMFTMAFFAIIYLVLRLGLTPEKIGAFFKKQKDDIANEFSENANGDPVIVDNSSTYEAQEFLKNAEQSDSAFAKAEKTTPTDTNPSTFEKNIQNLEPTLSTTKPKTENSFEVTSAPEEETIIPKEDVTVEIAKPVIEEEVTKNLSEKLVEDFGEFDPTLELGNFKFPPIDLLKDYTNGQGITINQEELELSLIHI